MKFKYLIIISMFLILLPMLTAVDAKTIEINENQNSNEIKNFFNNNGKIGNATLASGDTVIFQKGYYANLNLNIKKSITIKSKGDVYFNSTKIKGNKLKVNGIKFEKLTLTGNSNSVSKSYFGFINVKGTKNKIISSTIDRIDLRGSKNTLKKNKLTGYEEYGIRIFGSKNNLQSNVVNGFSDGIVLIKGAKNIISKNTIKNQEWNGVLIFSGSYNNKISNNKFSKNNCGVFHYYKSKNTISKNTFKKVKLKTSNFIEKGTLRYGY